MSSTKTQPLNRTRKLLRQALDSETLKRNAFGAMMGELDARIELQLLEKEERKMREQHEDSLKFEKLLRRISELHKKKQEDYESAEDPFANVAASKDFGVEPWIGSLIRLNDKVRRLQAFARKGYLANESAKDSLMDIAVYALITLILYEREESHDSGVKAAVDSSGAR